MTIDDIREEYALAQAKRRQKIEQLRQKNAVPPLAELDRKRRELLLLPIRAALFGEPFDAEENSKKLEQIEQEMIAAGGYPDPETAVPYGCPRCRDTGVLESGEMCGCMKRRVYREVYGALDLDAYQGSFSAFDLSLFEGDSKKKMERLKNLLSHFAEHPSRDVVTLSGYSGVGKTFLLSAVAKKAEEGEEGSVFFSGAFSLFSAFHAHRLGNLATLAPVYGAKLLILDDLGTEPLTQNVTREYLFDLLEFRRQSHLPILLATNMDREALVARYTEKVTSRLFDAESAWFITLQSRDLRRGG